MEIVGGIQNGQVLLNALCLWSRCYFLNGCYIGLVSFREQADDDLKALLTFHGIFETLWEQAFFPQPNCQ
jgi:hypothetical protein